MTAAKQLHTLATTVSTNEAASPDKQLIEAYSTTSDQQASQSASAVVNPDDPPWGVGQALVVWVTSVVLLFFMPLVTSLPYILYKVVVVGSTQGLSTDPNLIFYTVLGVLPAHVLTFLIVWLLVTKRGQRPFWQTLGWSWSKTFGPWKTIGLAVLLLGVGVLLTQFLGGKETQLDQVIGSSLKTRFATAILAVATAPMVEELTFRGVLYPALQRTLGMLWAVVLVSTLFAGVHLLQYFDNFGVVAVIIMLSVSLTLLRARTGRLLPSFVLHLVFNAIQAVVLGVQPFVGKSHTENRAAVGFLIRSLLRFFA